MSELTAREEICGDILLKDPGSSEKTGEERWPSLMVKCSCLVYWILLEAMG